MSDDPKPPKGSPAKVDYHRRQLRKLFSRTSDEQFLQMIWAIDALRDGRPNDAARVFSFPRSALEQSMASQYRVHQWELETLVIQLMLQVGETPKVGGPVFDCSKFESLANLVNRLRRLEDVESAVYLRSTGATFDVFDELHRIAQRTFHWQRGYFNLPQFYRFAFIYAQGKCGEYFQDRYRIPITELNFVGSVLYTHSLKLPWLNRGIVVPELGLTEDLMKKALPLLLLTVGEAREETRKIVDFMNEKHGRPLPTAFQPSILRRFPLVCIKEDSQQFVAPIPEIILMRVTSGLYYDVAPGGQSLLNEANDRFEQYSGDYIDALMARFDVRRAYRYEPKKGTPFDTPDVLVRDGGRLALVIECKATKLNYLAQFAEDPFEAERKQYQQIANGVLQLWRFFSHVRRGLIEEPVDADTAAMVLTLDSFMTLNKKLKAKVIKQADALADKEEDITAEDRRHVIFCPIQGLEEIVSVTTEDRFLKALKAAGEKRYDGWEFRELSRDALKDDEKIEQKKFPFELDGLLPWWKRLGEVRGASVARMERSND
jgi:hypothetical protein